MIRTAFLFFGIYCLMTVVQAQQPAKPWPETLLWRISGKNLKKPSFLFGTMHVQDKRVFNLGDSFYHHFERAEGFAMEINFNEYLDSLFTEGFQLAQERKLGYNTDADTLTEELKVAVIDTAAPAPKATWAPPPPDTTAAGIQRPGFTPDAQKEENALKKERNELIRSMLLYGRMPTILDAYLYGMAQRQGKWLGAVEEVKDQLHLKDELGKDIDPDADPEAGGKTERLTLSKMLEVYLAQDLNQIEELVLNTASSQVQNVIFHARNLKMLRSIDSLSPLRSMFYAVGAAHLPGDSGLIRLLRKKGYTVTPVFSHNRMAAEKYATRLPALSWHTVVQTDSIYRVDMPGIPTDYNVFGELVKMKVFVDISNMNYYFAGHSIAQFNDDELEATLRQMADAMHNRVTMVKNVDRNGMLGREGTLSNNGTVFRVQVLKKDKTAYFLMVGAGNPYRVNTKEANRFFSSFQSMGAGKKKTTADWVTFTLPEKGISVRMPVQPKQNKLFEKQADGSDWRFSVYDCNDQQAGLYYLLQIRDIQAGSYLESDTLFFDGFRSNLMEKDVVELKKEFFRFGPYPAMRFDARADKEGIFYKTLSVARGNRVYNLLVIGHVSYIGEKGPETFFESLQLPAYKKTEWIRQGPEDGTFHTQVPAPFVRILETEEADSTRVHYISYDPATCISYEVFKDRFPRNFWIAGDTAYLRNNAENSLRYRDTVLQRTYLKNGSLTALEQVVETPGNSALKKVRYCWNADTLYTLIAFFTKEETTNPVNNLFFDQFRAVNEQAKGTIQQSKAAALLRQLTEKDTLLFTEAKGLLTEVPFVQHELPLLHHAMLEVYMDDSLYWGSVRSKLTDVIMELSDSTTVEFVRNKYPQYTGKAGVQPGLLNLLINTKTMAAYRLLKELLIQQPPATTEKGIQLSYRIVDSLALTRTLFPEMLGLLKHPDYWNNVMDYIVKLTDSSLLDQAVLLPYAKDIRYIADTLLAGGTLNGEDVYYWEYYDLVKCLGRVKAFDMVRKFEAQQDNGLMETAAYVLLQHGEKPRAATLEKLAADNDSRLSLYDELKRLDKLALFPAKYKTQRYMAEARLYNYADEDYSPDEMEFLAEREADFNGERMRFFLFRVRFGETEDEATDYLGIAGPYALDKKNLESEGDANELHDDAFDKLKINQQFTDLLKQGEEWIKQKKKEKQD